MFEPFLTQLKALLQGGSLPGGTRPSRALLAVNLRDAAATVRTAQVALARARAEQQQDRRRLHQVRSSMEDLENRARNALMKGSGHLAREAAEAIALLTDEQAALETAISSFDEDLASLTESLHRAQGRLRDLKRGERSVDVRAHMLKAQSVGTGNGQSALAEAEERLQEIRQQQELDHIAEREFAALSVADRPGTLIEKLGDAGCGAPVKTRADDVLARLESDLPCLLQETR